MKLTHRLLIISFSLATTPVVAATFQFDAKGDEPLYKTELPKTVYQYSRSEALQDLTITNAAGEQVPYALLSNEELHPQTAIRQDAETLVIFPIKQSRLNNPNELSIQLEKNAGGTTVNVTTHDTANDAATGDLNTAYLVDAGKKHLPLKTLVVDWQGSENKLLSLDVLTSNNLKDWSHAGHAVLLKTSADDHTLLHNTISLDTATEARYLQIRPSDADNSVFNLTQVKAEYNSMRSLTPDILWQELQFSNREQNNKTGEISLDFESPGRYSASYLHIALPQTNTITNVKILVRKSGNDPWQYLRTASLYHITKQGRTYRNPDIALYPTAARYWRLQFNQAHGGLGKENPGLSVGWLPQTMVWNARGLPPFKLHVGNNPDIVNTVAIASLIPDYNIAPDLKIKKVQQLPKANLALATDLANNAGTAANNANSWTSPPDYKRWLLWGGLFIGVLLLAGMAYALLTSERVK